MYYKTGNIISEKIASEKWGSKTIEKLSVDLQYELKGLRGFSATNLKRMKIFYEIWSQYLHVLFFSNDISSIITNQSKNKKNEISPSVSDELENNFNNANISLFIRLYKNIR